MSKETGGLVRCTHACTRMGGLISTQYMYICIHAGCCSVSVRGRQVAILEAGECIGEIALLSAEPHTAEVFFFVFLCGYGMHSRDSSLVR